MMIIVIIRLFVELGSLTSLTFHSGSGQKYQDVRIYLLYVYTLQGTN